MIKLHPGDVVITGRRHASSMHKNPPESKSLPRAEKSDIVRYCDCMLSVRLYVYCTARVNKRVRSTSL